jgi:Tol biopolymer transport system component
MRRVFRAVLAAAVAGGLAAAGPATAAPARIAFVSGAELFTMRADGSDRVQLTRLGPRRAAYQPAWSPEGSRIAFTSAGVNGASRIWTMRADGGGAHPITPQPGHGSYEQSPAWSPDGARIAFARIAFGRNSLRTSIVIADADGTHERTLIAERLTRLGAITSPAWSPDGSRLLITRTVLDNQSYSRPSLYELRADGGGKRLLARDGGDGSYSPDGARIAFVSVRDRNGSSCGSDECSYRGEIYTMSFDGTSPVRLTNNDGADDHPAWSPDGGRIAFSSDRNFPAGEAPEIYTVAPDGSCLTWLTNGTAYSDTPAWKPGTPSQSSDPGACGAAGRQPLSDVDVRAADGHRTFSPYWLGPVFGTALLLSNVDPTAREVDFGYEDCGSYDAAACPPPIDLRNRSTCALHPFQEAGKGVKRHGALVYGSSIQGYDVFTGNTAISIFAVGRAGLDRVLAGLRPISASTPRAVLPAPVFGSNVWRRVNLVSSAHRRLHSVRRVARRLHLRRRTVTSWLALARELHAVGAKRRRCAPGDRPPPF